VLLMISLVPRTLPSMNRNRELLRYGTLLLLSLTSLCASAQSPSSETAQQLYANGQQALASGRYPEAEADLEKLRQLEPTVAEVRATLAVVYFQERKFDQVISEARHALKLKPGLPRLDSLVAMSLSELGQYEEARPGLEKCFRQIADLAVRRMCGLQLERTYTGLHRDEKAVQVALEMDRLYPKDPEVLYHDAKIFGNFAYLNIQKLAQVAPRSAWERLAAAEAYESQGANDAALAAYREVLSLDPQRPGVHYQMGRTLLARSRQSGNEADSTEALQAFMKELEIDPGSGNAAYEVAEIQRGRGNLPDAQKYFQLALQQYPQFEEANVGLAAVLLAQQNPQLARAHLQKAVSLNPDDAVAWYRLSLVERSLGNRTEQQNAIAEFQRVRHMAARTEGVTATHDVTRQTLDPGAPPE
jgi:tetratricopeptide (TPR) repeat protein